MIASVLSLTRAECLAERITDAYSVHRVVYSLFPQEESEARDFLFADQGGDFMGRKILILSRRQPQRPAVGRLEEKEIPASFLDGSLYGFEVRVNPTKRDKASGKTMSIRGNESLLTWFCEKAPEQYGFEVVVDAQKTPLIQVQDVGVQQFKKGESTVTHGTATFVGKLRVVDREAFRKAFENGIGRAKGFGFGLLKIIPLQDERIRRV